MKINQNPCNYLAGGAIWSLAGAELNRAEASPNPKPCRAEAEPKRTRTGPKALRFRVQGLGLGLRVQGLGLGFRVQGLGLRVVPPRHPPAALPDRLRKLDLG